MSRGWIGVDLDGTLAHYEKWKGVEHIGEPVPLMADRVRVWIASGQEVRIVTARVSDPRTAQQVRALIQDWLIHHFGFILAITCSKDFRMIELWDDRAVQVIPNTGMRADQVVNKDLPS